MQSLGVRVIKYRRCFSILQNSSLPLCPLPLPHTKKKKSFNFKMHFYDKLLISQGLNVMQKIKCLVPHCNFCMRLRRSLLIVPPSQIVSGVCAVYRLIWVWGHWEKWMNGEVRQKDVSVSPFLSSSHKPLKVVEKFWSCVLIAFSLFASR